MKNKKIIIISIILCLSLVTSFFIFTQINPKRILFEAKIGDELIFNNKDILSVGKANITQCSQLPESYECDYEISLKIDNTASDKYALVTSGLSVDTTNLHCIDINGNPIVSLSNSLVCPEEITSKSFFTLNESLDFYFNNTLIDSLSIPENLKGQKIYEISFYGHGSGKTENEAYNNTEKNMTLIQNYF